MIIDIAKVPCMLRRVARVLRIGLLVIGVAAIVWLPFSLFAVVSIRCDDGWVFSRAAYLGAVIIELPTEHGPQVSFEWQEGNFEEDRLEWTLPAMLHPTYKFDSMRMGDVIITIPLWLLAFLCLAWPVTSFLLARRRRGRGFAVEPLPTPLPPGEVPSPRGGEGGQ